MLTRFIMWLVRIIAIGVAVLGIIMIIVGIGDSQSEYVTPGIIMLVVGVIAAGVALKVGHKAKVKGKHKKVASCKKCGGAFNTRYEFEWNLSKATKPAFKSLYQVPVTIKLTCSNCGKVTYLYETVEISGVGDSDQEVRDCVETMMNEYFNG